MDELSTNNCMMNEPFVGYYQCIVASSTGQACPDWSCSEIGASIGVIDDDDDDYIPAAGSGELTGVTSDYLLSATLSPAVSSTADAVGSAAGVASAGIGRVVVVPFAVAFVGWYIVMAAPG